MIVIDHKRYYLAAMKEMVMLVEGAVVELAAGQLLEVVEALAEVEVEVGALAVV